MKTKLIPFDIEKAKNGAKIVTRSGLSAKRVDVDVNNGHPVLCLVTWKNGIETPILYSIDGRYYPDQTDDMDLFIEEEVEEDDDYNPYKEVVKSIADMAERYSELQSLEELKDFYDNVRVKCREAVEYNWEYEKPADNKPKFKVGDWVISEQGRVQQITNVIENVTNHTYGYNTISYSFDILSYGYFNENVKGIRLWNINDAKDGDVLVSKSGENILIFKQIESITSFSSYYNTLGMSNIGFAKDLFQPATKEQCNLLFQKMKEAGYQWDSERKELKKIEYKDDMAEKEVKQKSSFNEFGFRRMTNQELSWWLRDHPEEHRECRFETASFEYEIFTDYPYLDSAKDCEVPDRYYIRKNGREWQEPLVEI